MSAWHQRVKLRFQSHDTRARRSIGKCAGIGRPGLAFETLEPRLTLSVAPGLVDVGTQPAGALSGKIVFTSPGHGWLWSSSKGRYDTDDRSDYNEIVEPFGNQDQMTRYADYLLRAGATVVPMRPVGRQISEVVLDNDSPGVTFSATGWSKGNSTRYYDEDYGTVADTEPFWSANTVTGAPTATATYTPNIPQAGFYPVYTWVLWGSDRTVQTYEINHTGGTTQVSVDHSKVGSGWVYLGTYHFNAGSSSTLGSVQISNKAPTTGKVVIADAIRFGNGMGDFVASGAPGVSGYPREVEVSYNWIARMTGVGTQLSTAIGSGTTNVSAPSNMAQYMFHGTFGEALYMGIHSNGGGGRGARGLYTNDSTVRTPNQVNLAILMGDQINQDMQNLNGVFEYNWTTGTTNTDSNITFGEIDLGPSAEMDATIIEVAFHDDVSDAAIMRDPKGRDQIARSMYQGTLQYFATYGVPVVSNTSLPTAPINVHAESNASGAVTLSWTAGPSSPASVYGAAATGYRIYASVDGYGFDGGTIVNGGATTSTTLTGYDPAIPYYFRVVAVNAGGESSPSEVVTVLPSGGTKQILIVNGFDRFDRTQNMRYPYVLAPDGLADRVWPRYNNSFDYVVQVESAIQAAKPGIHVASTSNEAVINGSVNLTDYDTVIWILGTESSVNHTFDATEQAKVTSFVNAGGNLFLSGSEIGWDLDNLNNGRTFYETVLKGNYISDDANTYTVSSNAAGIFAGISNFTFSNGASFNSLDGQLYNVAFPDVIAPQPGAVSALSYSGGAGGTAAIQVPAAAGAGNVVMFGFPFEAIAGASSRQAVMGRILDFFGVVLPPNADFNSDGSVDAADFVVWRKNAGLASGATHTQGDANYDGAVDSADYDVWRSQFGTVFASGASVNAGDAAASSVPAALTPAVGKLSLAIASQAVSETSLESQAVEAAFARLTARDYRLSLRLASASPQLKRLERGNNVASDLWHGDLLTVVLNSLANEQHLSSVNSEADAGRAVGHPHSDSLPGDSNLGDMESPPDCRIDLL